MSSVIEDLEKLRKEKTAQKIEHEKKKASLNDKINNL